MPNCRSSSLTRGAPDLAISSCGQLAGQPVSASQRIAEVSLVVLAASSCPDNPQRSNDVPAYRDMRRFPDRKTE